VLSCYLELDSGEVCTNTYRGEGSKVGYQSRELDKRIKLGVTTESLATYIPYVTAVLITFAPILTNVPRTATSYGLGAVGERLGQRDARKAHSGGLGEANPALPRRARSPSTPS